MDAGEHTSQAAVGLTSETTTASSATSPDINVAMQNPEKLTGQCLNVGVGAMEVEDNPSVTGTEQELKSVDDTEQEPHSSAVCSEGVDNTETKPNIPLGASEGVDNTEKNPNIPLGASEGVDNTEKNPNIPLGASEGVDNTKKAVDVPPGVDNGLLANTNCGDGNGMDCPQTVAAQDAVEGVPQSSVKEDDNNSSFAMSLLCNYDWSESSGDSDTDSEARPGRREKTNKDDGNILAFKLDTLGTYRHQVVTVESGTDDSESDSEDDCSTVSSSSDTSSLTESSAESDIEILGNKNVRERVIRPNDNLERKKKNRLLTPGELTLEDLPPIQDLCISVREEEARPIGTIHSIVEQQVVVAGYQNMPAIDLDSVLFLDQGKRALGHVFDLFGPVQEPLYVVRFNSAEHIQDNRIAVGDKVYFAPTTKHTSFVVIDELMQIKGSDASGMKDNEVLASEEEDFSDDEKERRSKGNGEPKYHNSTNEFQPQRKRSRGQPSKSSAQRNNPFAVRGGMARFNQSAVRPSRFRPPSVQQHPPWGPGPSRPDMRGPPGMPHNRFPDFQNYYGSGAPNHNGPHHHPQFSTPPPGYQFGNPPNPSNTAGFPIQSGVPHSTHPPPPPPPPPPEMNGWPAEFPPPFQYSAPPPCSVQNGLPPPNFPAPSPSAVPQHTFQPSPTPPPPPGVHPPPFMHQFGTPPFSGTLGSPSPFSQPSVPPHEVLYPYHNMPPPPH